MTLNHQWSLIYGGGEPSVVIPINDIREHEEGACWCDPTENEDGTIVHHSADCRELYETGVRLPS